MHFESRLRLELRIPRRGQSNGVFAVQCSEECTSMAKQNRLPHEHNTEKDNGPSFLRDVCVCVCTFKSEVQ